MPVKKPTSFVLNETAQKIKDDLSPVYGLKNILSAGLLLFDKQADIDKLIAIKVARGDIAPEQLTAGEQRLQKTKKALSIINEVKLKFDGSEQAPLDVQYFCNELLNILREPSLIEDIESTLSPAPGAIRQMLKEMVEAERQMPGTLIKILSKEDSALTAEFRKALGPEPQKKRKAKRG